MPPNPGWNQLHVDELLDEGHSSFPHLTPLHSFTTFLKLVLLSIPRYSILLSMPNPFIVATRLEFLLQIRILILGRGLSYLNFVSHVTQADHSLFHFCALGTRTFSRLTVFPLRTNFLTDSLLIDVPQVHRVPGRSASSSCEATRRIRS